MTRDELRAELERERQALAAEAQRLQARLQDIGAAMLRNEGGLAALARLGDEMAAESGEG